MSSKTQLSSVLYAIVERKFTLSDRKTSIRREVIAGLTTFLAMVYSVVVVPNMLGLAGFEPGAVFVSTCLIAAFGSLMMGLWANLPMAVGCAISLTAFTAFSLVMGQGISIPVTLGAIFWMGVIFTLISVTGVRRWILANLPRGIAHGTGIGIGLFLLLIASNSVGLIVGSAQGMPVKLGNINNIGAIAAMIGLGVTIGLERKKVPGGILIVIIALTIFGLIFDPNVHFLGFFALPNFSPEHSLIGQLDFWGALNPAILPLVLALVMTAIFDATGAIRAVAGQAELLDKDDNIISGEKALLTDSISSIFAGIMGGAPVAVSIESAAGTAAGGKTGLTATVVGCLFILLMFFAPLSYLVPAYATAPALMYVGLLMLSHATKLDLKDRVDTMAGLTCAVFIVLSSNIVTGIMMGFVVLVIGRVFAGEWCRLNIPVVVIAVSLLAFYLGGWAI